MEKKNSKTPMNVAIVGGGTTGPAVALFLKRAGHQVTLFEKVSQLSPVGAGVLLQPTGMEVLNRLGLLEAVEHHGAPVRYLHSQNRSGKTFLHLNYSELSPGLNGLGLHRAVLCHYLFQALNEEKIPFLLGKTILRMEKSGPKTHLVDEEGCSHGPFDLLILADGARSALREQTGLVRRAPRYPWGALWFIGRDPEKKFTETLFQLVHGTRKMVGLLPTGLDVEGRSPLVSLFWSLEDTAREACRKEGLEAWKRQVLDLVPQAQSVVDQIESFDQLTFAAYYDVVMEKWHEDSVVVLGDAAHAMSPQLGQGVNLGFYDAMVLSDCLAEFPRLEEALRNYSLRRKRHLRFYQFATRWATPFFQSSTPGLSYLRDYGFSFLNAMAPIRRQMIRAMAGLKRGFVRRSLPVFQKKEF